MKIKIGFMCVDNPEDRHSWSGTFYKMFEHLKSEGVEVEWIQLYLDKTGKLIKLIYILLCKVFGKKPVAYFLKNLADHYLFRPCDLNKYDIIYAPCSSPYLYKLDINIPIIYMSDSSPEGLFDYYTFNYFSFIRRHGNEMERVALEKSKKIIYASEWAKNIAVDFYKQKADKIEVIEIGANMDELDLKEILSIKANILKDDKLHILFIGVDWVRKGGDIALNCCRLLNERGIRVVFHIIGIKEIPEECKDKAFVDFVGFLNKNDKLQNSQLMNYIAMSDILLLPTLAECAGVVFNECAACGIPSFTHLTGGTGNYVVDGVNGYTLPLGSSSEDFANLIERVVNTGELNELKASCIDFYQRRNNWDIWGKRTKALIADILKK